MSLRNAPHTPIRRLALALLLGAALPAAALAQAPAPHAGHPAPAPVPAPAAAPAAAPAHAMPADPTEASKQAMERMHHAMMIPYTGNADVDFVRGMIPHHQGAIDMARIELAHGKDPELRRMAQEMIDAQQREIAAMNEWLARHAPAAHAPAPHGKPPAPAPAAPGAAPAPAPRPAN